MLLYVTINCQCHQNPSLGLIIRIFTYFNYSNNRITYRNTETYEKNILNIQKIERVEIIFHDF